jgi:hypothetical protein
MWVFYLISLPLTVGMVISTLKYFAGPEVPRYVLFTVGYTWFCSLSVIILVPADIWAVRSFHRDFTQLLPAQILFDWMLWLVLLRFLFSLICFEGSRVRFCYDLDFCIWFRVQCFSCVINFGGATHSWFELCFNAYF